MTHLIAIENSSWNNIGDAFYANSIEAIITSLSESFTIAPLESPLSRSFRPLAFQKENLFELGLEQKADLVILSGPILNHFHSDYYIPLILRLQKHNIPYLIISTHGTDGRCNKALEMLSSYSPACIITRDEATACLLKKHLNNSIPVHNSLCFAYYTPYTLPTLPIDSADKLLTACFYKKEPNRLYSYTVSDLLSSKEARINLANDYKNWPDSTAFKRFSSLYFSDKHEFSSDQHKIVYTTHDTSHRLPFCDFSKKNTFLSRRPEGYISLYKSSDLVITDRVHACIASIAHGSHCIYLSSSNRDGAITNLGAAISDHYLYTANPQVIHEQYCRVKDILRNELLTALT